MTSGVICVYIKIVERSQGCFREQNTLPLGPENQVECLVGPQGTKRMRALRETRRARGKQQDLFGHLSVVECS